MKRETLTLVGRSHGLAIENGAANWKVVIRLSQDEGHTREFALVATAPAVIEQCEQMAEGALIGLIAELPPVSKRIHGVPLTVTRLELLGKPLTTTKEK